MTFEARLISANVGEDAPDMNFGNNILLPNVTRVSDYGNELGQGVGADINIIGLDVSYQLFHNVFLDLNYFYRKKESDDNALDLKTQYIGAGIRANINRQRWDF